MRIKHYYCLKNKFGLLRFLNRYEIPYQTEDSFEVLGTSVQVSDKEYLFELYEDQKVYEKFKQQLHLFQDWIRLQSVNIPKEKLKRRNGCLFGTKA